MIITNNTNANDIARTLNTLRATLNVATTNDVANTNNDASNVETMTITHKLTKIQRARLRRFHALHNIDTTKFAKYSTRAIRRDAYEYAMSNA